MLVVRESFDKPIGLRVVHPPIFLWFFRAFYLAQRVGFCLLPLLAHCFEGNVEWSTYFLSLAPNKRF